MTTELPMRADISRLNAERDEAIAAVATEREACAKVCDELEAHVGLDKLIGKLRAIVEKSSGES